MKKINFRLLGLFVVFLSVFSNQIVFADIIIRKDDPAPGGGSNIISLKSAALKSQFVIAVTADIVGTDLIVDFNNPVGIAFVSVVDQNGNVVYQTSVDTTSALEVIIPVDGLSTGKYSVKIAYGSTKLIGDFQL